MCKGAEADNPIVPPHRRLVFAPDVPHYHAKAAAVEADALRGFF